MKTVVACLLLLVIFARCSPGESRLSGALSTAVKEKKVSERKRQALLNEYENLSRHDAEKARRFVESILNAIEMGGDSTHIDVARQQVLKNTEQNPEKTI